MDPWIPRPSWSKHPAQPPFFASSTRIPMWFPDDCSWSPMTSGEAAVLGSDDPEPPVAVALQVQLGMAAGIEVRAAVAELVHESRALGLLLQAQRHLARVGAEVVEGDGAGVVVGEPVGQHRAL